MKTISKFLLWTTQVFCLAAVLLAYGATASYAGSFRPDAAINEVWYDHDYSKIRDFPTADGNCIHLTQIDDGPEQIFRFEDWDGIDFPTVSRIRVYVYGKKGQSGNPSPLSIRVRLAGCWLSPAKTITMTTSFAQYNVYWSASNPYWTG